MSNKDTPVLPLIYDLILWYSPKISQYPKKYKFTLGDKITNTMLEILEAVIEAKYAAKKKAHLYFESSCSMFYCNLQSRAG